jgi:hypothetical protein
MFEYHPKTELMLYKKCPIGTITRRDDRSCDVTDVRGKVETYASFDEALEHFTRFESWGNYTYHTPPPPSRTIRKNTELRARFAST